MVVLFCFVMLLFAGMVSPPIAHRIGIVFVVSRRIVSFYNMTPHILSFSLLLLLFYIIYVVMIVAMY